jgi:hypothetical protein
VDTELVLPGTHENASAAFLRLELDEGGLVARGYGSLDGASWGLIHEETFEAPLPVQGLAASGHGSASPIKFLFGAIGRDEGSGPVRVERAMLSDALVGSGVEGAAFAGPFE